MSDTALDMTSLAVLANDLILELDPAETPESIRLMLGGLDPTDVLGNMLNKFNASSVEELLPAGLQPLISAALEAYNG